MAPVQAQGTHPAGMHPNHPHPDPSKPRPNRKKTYTKHQKKLILPTHYHRSGGTCQKGIFKCPVLTCQAEPFTRKVGLIKHMESVSFLDFSLYILFLTRIEQGPCSSRIKREYGPENLHNTRPAIGSKRAHYQLACSINTQYSNRKPSRSHYANGRSSTPRFFRSTAKYNNGCRTFKSAIAGSRRRYSCYPSDLNDFSNARQRYDCINSGNYSATYGNWSSLLSSLK